MYSIFWDCIYDFNENADAYNAFVEFLKNDGYYFTPDDDRHSVIVSNVQEDEDDYLKAKQAGFLLDFA